MNFGFYVPELSPGAGSAGNNEHAGVGSGAGGNPSTQIYQQPSLAEHTAEAAVHTELLAAHAEQQGPLLPESAQTAKPKAAASSSKPIGMACRACRLRKIRCGGERPRCSYCVKKGYECVLTPHKKRGRPRKNEQRAQAGKLPGQSQRRRPGAAGGSIEDESSDEEELAAQHLQQIGGGIKAMSIPIDTDGLGLDMGPGAMDGLDLDVRQLWAELTGLQGLDLPPELSALAANSATQLIETNTSNIPNVGPSFNLGIAMPHSMQGQLPASEHPSQVPAIGDSALFASNYAFPRYDPALASMSTAPQCMPLQPMQQPMRQPEQRPAVADQTGRVASSSPMTPSQQPPAIPALNSQQNQTSPLQHQDLEASQPQPQSQHQNQNPNPNPNQIQHRLNRVDSPSSSARLSCERDSTPGMAPKTSTSAATTERSRHRAHSEGAQNRARSSSTQGSMPILQTIDEGIRQYFVYVHPWLPILHRPTFEKQVLEGTVDPILYYSVQAISARFRERDISRPHATRRPYRRGQRYARAAQALLPHALKNARLSTLQAISILALYMSMSGHWQEGAAYEKLAVQLAFIGQYHLLDEEFLLPPVTNNMGLYESGWSEHSHPARLEVLSRPGGILEHEQRRRAWWAIFQLERFNGLAMGRPPIIKPGWHWVWLPCSETLWASENPSGALAWEMGLAADFAQRRPPTSVSNCRVDLILALIMGQMIEQRTDMFRLFFPRVDRGTLFYDNLPTHSLGWPARLRRLAEVVAGLERRIRQWHAELDRYADSFSARRHANFEIMGASCQIHLYACVLQIREHLFEDLLVNEEVKTAAMAASSETATPASGVPIRQTSTTGSLGKPAASAAAAAASYGEATLAPDQMSESFASDGAASSRNSSVDLSAMFERHMGMPFDKSTYQRGYMAKAKRPDLTLRFVQDLDTLSQQCWDRSVAMADEIARLLRVHWLRPFDQVGGGISTSGAGSVGGDLTSFISATTNVSALAAKHGTVSGGSGIGADPSDADARKLAAEPSAGAAADTLDIGSTRSANQWTLGATTGAGAAATDTGSGSSRLPKAHDQSRAHRASKHQRQDSTISGDSSNMANLDPQIADRFKLMNPQTPYHLFIAGKVQAARLKQASTAQARVQKKKEQQRQQQQKASQDAMDIDDDHVTSKGAEEGAKAFPSQDASSGSGSGGGGGSDYAADAISGDSPEVVEDAIRRINDIWEQHALDADAKAIEARLDDIITALEYCQLFWYSLNFASHLKYLKGEAAKPLLHSVYRE
ncbi:hypothetical protein GGI07_004240 [Coemansia sp. Benny D115]|nr:hypothetical protein GGI07_004240 [Coemansia sp. Benny D115]